MTMVIIELPPAVASAPECLALDENASPGQAAQVVLKKAPNLPPFNEGPLAIPEVAEMRKILLEAPHTFDTWQKLLPIVEKSGGTDEIQAVYTAFLDEFPLCWGYWKRLADLEAKESGFKAASVVYENGMSAGANVTVDLWVHYCDAAAEAAEAGDDTYSLCEARSLFERGVAEVGLDWHSGPLWEGYIDFEESNRDWKRAGALYLRALAMPIGALNAIHVRFRALLVSDDAPAIEDLFPGEQLSGVLALDQLAVQDRQQDVPADEGPSSKNLPPTIEVASPTSAGNTEDPSCTRSSCPAAVAGDHGTFTVANNPIGSTVVADNDAHAEEGEVKVDGTALAKEAIVPNEVEKYDEHSEEGEITVDEPTLAKEGQAEEGEISGSEDGELEEGEVPPEPFVPDVMEVASKGHKRSPSTLESLGRVAKARRRRGVFSEFKNVSVPWTLDPERQTVLQAVNSLFNATASVAKVLGQFETKLQRSYFHEKLLSNTQLDTWWRYLDFEDARSPPDECRKHKLYKRCLVATNNYLEFWLRYACVLESGKDGVFHARSLLERACMSGRLRGRLDALMAWAEQEEVCGNIERARAIFDGAIRLAQNAPVTINRFDGSGMNGTLVEVFLRSSYLETRSGNLQRSRDLLCRQAQEIDNIFAKSCLARHHARFCEDILLNPMLAKECYENVWREGCRDLPFVVDFATCLMKTASAKGAGEDRTTALSAASTLFEETLNLASISIPASEILQLWTHYIDFLVCHGAPLMQLREVQVRARSFERVRRLADDAMKTPVMYGPLGA